MASERKSAQVYTYETVSNDSLPSIAEAFGHSGEWQALWFANSGIVDPNHISPGWEIILPTGWAGEDDGGISPASSTNTGSSTNASTASNASPIAGFNPQPGTATSSGSGASN